MGIRKRVKERLNQASEEFKFALLVFASLLIMTALRLAVNDLALIVLGDKSDVFTIIVAPVLTLAGTGLVYFALRVQIATNEREETKLGREKALQSSEAAIRAAGLELTAQLATLQECMQAIYDYSALANGGRMLDEQDQEVRKQDLIKHLQSLDDQLLVAAGLLTIAFEILQDNNLTAADKSYCLVLFEKECMHALASVSNREVVSFALPAPTASAKDSAVNANRILQLGFDFYEARQNYYTQVMAREYKGFNNPWS